MIIFIFLLLFGSRHLYSQTNKSYDSVHAIPSPRIFGEGTISTGDYESHPAFTVSGDTLFFIKCAPDFSTWTIFVSYFRNGKWSDPEVAPFSGKYMDADPFVTKDGREVYFISNRPVKEGEPAKEDEDIWKVVLTPQGWSEPIRLDAPINSDRDEYYPSIADNGTLYFGSARTGGKGSCDMYRSENINGRYMPAENLGDSVNTEDDEYEPFISADEKYLLFMATKPNGLKNADLYISYNINGAWSKAQKLPVPFNTAAIEFSPKVTRDGKYFFFSSTRNILNGTIEQAESADQLTQRIRSAGNGLGDIYQVDFSALELRLK